MLLECSSECPPCHLTVQQETVDKLRNTLQFWRISGKEKVINMFSKRENSKTVGIYEGKELNVCIHCATEIIIDHSLEVKNDSQWLLYCLSERGSLFMVGKQNIEKCLRRVPEHHEEREEIFSDLLGEEFQADLQLSFATQPVYVLDNSDIILGEVKDPVRLCVSTKYVVIVTGNAKKYTLHLFEKLTDGSCTNERVAELLNFQLENIVYSPENILIKIVTCECVHNGTSICSEELRIDTTLFKQIFGEDAVLLDSPVLLFALQNGSVFFIYLSSFVPKSNFSDSDVTFENANFSNSWKLMCHMSSTVTDVTVLSLENNSNENATSALCIVGHDGKVTVFQRGTGGPEYSVTELFISSPVLSMCSFHNRLFYSCGYNLFESIIELSTTNSEEARHSQLHISQTKVHSAKYVREIHHASANGYLNTAASPCYLQCSTINGEMKVIETSAWMDFAKETDTLLRESVKDILMSIEDVDKRRDEVKNQSKSQGSTLGQLNVASYLLAWYESQTSRRPKKEGILNNRDTYKTNGLSESSVFPVNVVMKASASRNIESGLTEISLEVTNKMPVALLSDWTLTASLNTTADQSHSISTTIKVGSDWRQNEKLVLILPVAFDRILTGCKLLVKATLMADRLLHKSQIDTKNVEKYCLSVPLFESDIDILDCLVPASSVVANESLCKERNTLDSQIVKQAQNQSFYRKIPAVGKGIDDVTVLTHIEVHFPSLLSGAKDKNNPVVCALLGKTLSNTLSGSSDIQPNSCHLKTTAGHSIHFNFQHLKKDRGGEHGDEMTQCERFQVMVRCIPRIAASLHTAIRCREAKIEQICEHRSKQEIKTDNARKAIQTAQEITTQLGSHKMEETVMISAFEKLRNVEL